MNKFFNQFVIVAALAAVASCEVTSPVEQCSGQHFEDLSNRIKVDPCGLKKCKLTILTNTTVTIKFKLTERVEKLVNNVHAEVFKVVVPFVGVTGVNICERVRYADTAERARCPLEPGVEYVYEDKFFIQSFYPQVNVRVHWSLKDGDHRDVICFEVPAVIVKSKNKNKSF